MRQRLSYTLLFLATLFLAFLSFSARAATTPRYQFTRLAESREEGVFVGFPVINNRGEAATWVQNEQVARFYLHNGRKRVQIAERRDLDEIGNLAISDRGHVAFPASLLNDDYAIFRIRNGETTTIASTAPGVFDSFNFGVSVNDRGTVAFAADLVDGDSGVFLGRGGEIAPVFLSSAGVLSGSPKPTINDRGQVAFQASTEEEKGVFLWNRGRVTTIVDTSSPGLADVDSDIALNDRGQVAFIGLTEDENFTIFKGRRGRLRRVVDDTETFHSFFGAPSINERGEVLFWAAFNVGGEDAPPEGIFLASGGEIIPVIRAGDPLDGSTVTDVYLARERTLNNRGQVVFGADLEDGRFAVYLGTPRRR